MQYDVQKPLFHFDTPLTYVEVLQAFPVEKGWSSRLSIAKRLGMAKSPHLVLKLTDLAADGFLDMNTIQLPNGVDMFVYKLTPSGLIARNLGEMPSDWIPRK